MKASALPISPRDALPGPKAEAIYHRAVEVIPGGVSRSTIFWRPHPPYASRGEGCYVTDVDGNELLDVSNNFFSLVHGHAHPEIVAAVQAQAAEGTAFGLPTELEVEFAETLASRAPGLDQVRFFNSGTEAVMTALKAARAYTGKPRVAKMEGAYHGTYDHAQIAYDSSPQTWGSRERPSSTAFYCGTPEAVLSDTLVLPFNDLASCESLIAEAADSLAAVLLDAVPSRVAMVPGSAEFLAGLQKCCRAHNVLLILDEVITFRLDTGGAQTRFDIAPDLTTLGKVIGGGLPVGAIAGRRDVMSVFDGRDGRAVLPDGGTFSANPLTLAAGRASLRLLDRAAIDRIDSLGDMLREQAAAIFAGADNPWQITGVGSIFRIHPHQRTIRGFRDAFPAADELERRAMLFRVLLSNGVLTTPNVSGNVATVMTQREVDKFLSVLERGVAYVDANADRTID